jgi:hypothetical protein
MDRIRPQQTPDMSWVDKSISLGHKPSVFCNKTGADKIRIISGNFSGSNRLRRRCGARAVSYHGLWPMGEVQYDVHQTPSHGNPARENHMQYSHLEESSCTCSIRIWKSPRVKVGGRYQMDEGHIVVDSITQITVADITNDLARESGFASVADLLRIARHGSGDKVYLIRFHYWPYGVRDTLR